jgi:hypothetical protein
MGPAGAIKCTEYSFYLILQNASKKIKYHNKQHFLVNLVKHKVTV